MDPRRLAVALLAGVLVAACTSEPEVVIETALVASAEVVQTVAVPATLEPAARVSVTAPLGGEVAELLVADGDTVAAGDPIARLSSDSLDAQIAQAEAAVEAADALAAAAGAAGVDLSPVIRAFRSQLDGSLPPILDALEGQTAAIEDDEIRDEAAARLAAARASYQEASRDLQVAERQAAAQANAATASQRAAADAQRRQAELALAAARGRDDDLLLVAPIDGVLELGRTDGGGAAVGDLGDLGGGLPGDVGALLGGGGTSSPVGGPIAVGVTLSPGQVVATLYDLSSFTARAEVDEIDIIELDTDQAVTVLVDAFPAAELLGVVAHIAIAPAAGPPGGATYPVTIRLTQIPDEVRLRVGLTASAEIEVRRVDGDTVVPTSALLRRGGQEVVFTIVDGTAREVPVTVTAIGDDTAAVEGDLRVGDRVVTRGVETVADGDRL